ncbi:MAG: FCD domain-containing protein [Defluviitaleaceae bacterium]|nr:FCD domain-containing protein [Defluviitaleaceae bacterium]
MTEIIAAIIGAIISGVFSLIFFWKQKKQSKNEKIFLLEEVLLNIINIERELISENSIKISLELWDYSKKHKFFMLSDRHDENNLYRKIYAFYSLVIEFNNASNNKKEKLSEQLIALAGTRITNLKTVLDSLGSSLPATIVHEYDPLHEIEEQCINEYETGVSEQLMRLAEECKESFMGIIRVRFLRECEIIKKVVQLASEPQKNALMEKLDFMEKKESVTAMSKYDWEFHQLLYRIAEDFEFDEWVKPFYQKFEVWGAIELDSVYPDQIIQLHKDILSAVFDRDEKGAIKAMQKHFAFILWHFIETCKPKYGLED